MSPRTLTDPWSYPNCRSTPWGLYTPMFSDVSILQGRRVGSTIPSRLSACLKHSYHGISSISSWGLSECRVKIPRGCKNRSGSRSSLLCPAPSSGPCWQVDLRLATSILVAFTCLATSSSSSHPPVLSPLWPQRETPQASGRWWGTSPKEICRKLESA